MSQPQLHQKVGLALCVLSLVSCSFAERRKSSGRESLGGYLGTIYLRDRVTTLEIVAFSDGPELSLLWDTGSDTSFWNEERSEDLVWKSKKHKMQSFPGQVPGNFAGLLGADFFQKTCIWWEESSLEVFDSASSFCTDPQAYVPYSLAVLKTKLFRGQAYAEVILAKGGRSWALLDTGASLSLFPPEDVEGEKPYLERKVKVFGNRELALQEFRGTIVLGTTSGHPPLVFPEERILNGIKIEDVPFLWEKGTQVPRVVGQSLLKKAPVFWDFARGKVAIARVK